MNFYKYKKDQCLHNQSYIIVYTLRYICFVRFESDNKIDCNWQQKQLNKNYINYCAADKLIAKNLLVDSNDFKHSNYLIRYILLNIFNIYFL